MLDVTLLFFKICSFDPNLTRINHRFDLLYIIKYKFRHVSMESNSAEGHFIELSLQNLCDHHYISSFAVNMDWNRLVQIEYKVRDQALFVCKSDLIPFLHFNKGALLIAN